ncbi:MAG: TAXI family TRAP transporter solute-binding subunit [Gammaproteobacteria bacterium]
MLRAARAAWSAAQDFLGAALPFALLAAVLLAAAYFALDPAPPRRVVLATGPQDGAYATFGERYVRALARNGIEVELRPTAGSAENLTLLRDPTSGVDLAFVRGGSGAALRSVDDTGAALASLGSLFYEPVWVFYRHDSAARSNPDGRLAHLTALRGWKVNLDTAGSGVANLFEKVLDANGMAVTDIVASRQPLTPAVMALLAGEIDAVVVAAAPETPMVQMLLRTPGIGLFEYAQADAYSRLLPFLSAVRLPRGIADLALDAPPSDIELVSSTTLLLARADTHPALVQLFVQAARRIHGGAGWLARAGQFPSARSAQFPLAAEADRFYRNGPPLLQRYLPFWLANLIDRMWVVGVSIIAILIPLTRWLPPLYAFRVRSRVFRWYRRLREIEESLARGTGSRVDLLADIDALEARIRRIVLPLAYTDELYALRSYIQMVRERVQRTAPDQGAAGSGRGP